jgi:hypothetical protein
MAKFTSLTDDDQVLLREWNTKIIRRATGQSKASSINDYLESNAGDKVGAEEDVVELDDLHAEEPQEQEEEVVITRPKRNGRMSKAMLASLAQKAMGGMQSLDARLVRYLFLWVMLL